MEKNTRKGRAKIPAFWGSKFPLKVTSKMKVLNTVKPATITPRERINVFLNVQLLLKQRQNFKCPNWSKYINIDSSFDRTTLFKFRGGISSP